MRSAGNGRNIRRFEHADLEPAGLPEMVGHRFGVGDNRALTHDDPLGIVQSDTPWHARSGVR